MTTKGEWKVYTGSDEQIDEMCYAKHGFIVKSICPCILNDAIDTSNITGLHYWIKSNCITFGVTHYLLCTPHPLADMICQQARTGQPVWFKDKETGKVTGPVTKGIDWDELDFYEYSFTPFDVAS